MPYSLANVTFSIVIGRLDFWWSQAITHVPPSVVETLLYWPMRPSSWYVGVGFFRGSGVRRQSSSAQLRFELQEERFFPLGDRHELVFVDEEFMIVDPPFILSGHGVECSAPNVHRDLTPQMKRQPP